MRSVARRTIATTSGHHPKSDEVLRSSLLVRVRYLALAMRIEYRGGGRPIRTYENTRNQLDAIYASERLHRPFEGVFLIG